MDAEEVPWTAKEGSAPFWNGPFVSGQMNYFSPGGSYTGSKSGVYFDVYLTRSQERCVHYKDYPDKIACISTVADPGSACKIEYKVHKSDDLADVTPLGDVHVTGGVDTVYEYIASTIFSFNNIFHITAIQSSIFQIIISNPHFLYVFPILKMFIKLPYFRTIFLISFFFNFYTRNTFFLRLIVYINSIEHTSFRIYLNSGIKFPFSIF